MKYPTVILILEYLPITNGKMNHGTNYIRDPEFIVTTKIYQPGTDKKLNIYNYI